MLRKLRIVALSLLAASASALCVSAQAQTTLRIGLAEDPDVLDPTMSRTFVGRIVYAAMCDKLFDIDDKLNIVPQLALGYDTSADGKAVTIKLRAGVKFQDGEPLDAAAAKFSLERHLNTKGSFRRPEISSIDSIEVVDPLTIRLHLKAPFAPLIAQLADRAGMMVSPKAAQAEGADFGNHPVCAGPFKFVERVAQGRIVLERFADYWDKDKIKIDRVIYTPIPDSTVRLANLQSGSLDLIERVQATDIPTVKKDSKLKLSTQIELGYQGLTINLANGDRAKNPLGQDARVRQAFELALDRDAINQVVYAGEYLPGNQWVSPKNPYYQADLPVPKRDVAKAKKLLAEAGVKTPIALTLMLPNNPDLRQVGEVIQAMVKEAGFDLKLQATEFATSLNTAEKGDFDIYMLAWSGRVDPDGNINVFINSKSPQNYGHYVSAEVDDLLAKSRLTSKFEDRKKIYHDLAVIALRDLPIIYLYHRELLVAHTDKVQGFVPYPDGLIRLQGVSMK